MVNLSIERLFLNSLKLFCVFLSFFSTIGHNVSCNVDKLVFSSYYLINLRREIADGLRIRIGIHSPVTLVLLDSANTDFCFHVA